MSTILYLLQILRHPARWRSPCHMLWENTIPGLWLSFLGSACHLWPENAGFAAYAAREYGHRRWHAMAGMTYARLGMGRSPRNGGSNA
jgi:hypothetical protein